MAGLDPAIHALVVDRTSLAEAGITGSSPVMTTLFDTGSGFGTQFAEPDSRVLGLTVTTPSCTEVFCRLGADTEFPRGAASGSVS